MDGGKVAMVDDAPFGLLGLFVDWAISLVAQSARCPSLAVSVHASIERGSSIRTLRVTIALDVCACSKFSNTFQDGQLCDVIVKDLCQTALLCTSWLSLRLKSLARQNALHSLFSHFYRKLPYSQHKEKRS